jgi:hypothetical protein
VSKVKWNFVESSRALVDVSASEVWSPYHVDWDKEKSHILRVRKLVPQSSLKTSVQRSSYYALAEKGANIGPITFVSLSSVSPQNGDFVAILPDIEGGKPPFESPPYSSAMVESRYIFPYVKSRQLVPFGITKTLHCFLPVEVVGDHMEFGENLAPRAAIHWSLLASQYATLRAVPEGKDLFTHYLNHKHHLESPKMLARYKVVFNEGGQRVKAALLRRGEVVEHTLVFVPVASEDEGLYLAGIFNSDYISEFFSGAGGRGSARHVSLRPLEFPIPPFDVSNPVFGKIQEEIVGVAHTIEGHVEDLIQNLAKIVSPITIEKRARSYFPDPWNRLNSLVPQLFNS